jgi:hypothetical protein
MIAALTFSGKLDAGQMAAIIAAIAAVVGTPLVWLPVRAARRAVQAETLLNLMLTLQTPESVEAAQRAGVAPKGLALPSHR